MDDQQLTALAQRNQQIAWKLIDEQNIFDIWESIGAEILLVGSLPTGLMMTRRHKRRSWGLIITGPYWATGAVLGRSLPHGVKIMFPKG